MSEPPPASDPRPTAATPGPSGPVVRPRTISPFGPPVPVPPPVEAFVDPTWHPPTGPVPVVDVDPGPDPEIWTTDYVAAPSPDAPGRGRRLLRANLVVASGTMVSRATGLVRTSLVLVLLAKSLGDAYLGANNTPNMIYELILGGILTASLVPLFTDDLERGDGQHATSAIISVAVLALLAVTALGFLAGPALILLFSTGSTAALRDDYVSVGVPLALLFAPQIFFYGLMAVWSALLNARHRFLAAAWAPVLNNLIAIATLWYAHTLVEGKPSLADALDDRRIIWVLGIGTTAGIATMALSLYPALRRSGFRFRWSPDRRHPAVRRAVRLSAWTLGYVIANQVAAVVIQILAKPASGDVTRYQTAFQFFQLPHALLAVSIMVTFEPLLGRADARGDLGDYNRQLLLGFRLIALLIIPAAVGYVALPKGLDARTFEVEGELLTRAFSITGVVAAFAVGLPGFSTYLYALRGFYAKKNTKIPFAINCIENAINVALAIVFVRLWGVVGLALAFGLAYDLAAVIAVVSLSRHSPGFDWRGLASTWLRLLVAGGIMGGFVYGVVVLLAPGSALALVPVLAAGIAVGAIVYFALIYVLGVPGISDLMARLPVVKRFA